MSVLRFNFRSLFLFVCSWFRVVDYCKQHGYRQLFSVGLRVKPLASYRVVMTKCTCRCYGASVSFWCRDASVKDFLSYV